MRLPPIKLPNGQRDTLKKHPFEVAEGLVGGAGDGETFVTLDESPEWTRGVGVWFDHYGVITGLFTGKV